MSDGSKSEKNANKIALGALIVALGGLVYQQIQISQIEKGLELAQTALTLDRKAEGRRLLDEALDVLATTPGVQYELRHVGDALPSLVTPPDRLSAGCDLSQTDRSALARAGDLLASAIAADPAAPQGLDRLLAIAALLEDDSLLQCARAAVTSTDDVQRIELLRAALQSDFERVEKLVSDIARNAKSSIGLKRTAAEALARIGKRDAAIAQLEVAQREHWQDPALAYSLARILTHDPNNRTSLEKALEVSQNPIYFNVQRPHFLLLEHDVLVALGRFPEAWKAVEKLRERNLFLEASVPYPWSQSVLAPLDVAPQAELDGIDATIQQCPSARAALASERASLLMSLGKCEEALVAVSKTMTGEWQVSLYRAMAADPKERVTQLRSLESSLAERKDADGGAESTSGLLAFALWSQADGGKAQRAATLASAVRAQHASLAGAAPEQARKLESYVFLSPVDRSLSVEDVLRALDELAAPNVPKKRSATAQKIDAQLTRASKLFLSERSMCKR
jgi:tetratricopeptide (TPR) repeat protein